jgi:hypothetical protein
MNQEERLKKTCLWVNKLDGSFQLQSGLWWVGHVKLSELKEGLVYWKVALCPENLQGYADTIEDAAAIVEALVKTDTSYAYTVNNSIPNEYSLPSDSA